MHAYSLTAPTLAEAFRVGILPGRISVEVPYAPLGTGQVRFNRNTRPNTHAVLKTLSSGEAYSRAKIAQDAELSKNAVRHEVEKLVQERRLQKTVSGNTYLYSLPNASYDSIRRSPCYWWKRCPSCNADRKLRRLNSGNWQHWCGCGHEMIISREVVG